ncbi:hypothetical protein SISSUDRAFT_1057007 [Sistotremastrum suecicum HHB10207 ss-3]|uniref:Autophagy-related protein 2 n=1 Tax=Sistotremastrum suecicum HHB10207 ss-3 TaxID=1314776 RepID=A0A166IRF2_9AGAM|nr:hypothetical protein SISSUDRAFT_1057007 [Sistotremastrum suecicum HHB10207 ss-3]
MAWLPFTLPSFGIPVPSLSFDLQRRFVSFVLRKSLGHLLRPGNLDVDQIEGQVSEGLVELKDLVINEEAINQYLVDSPLRLKSGHIEKVRARLPWPNILSAPISLSIASIHLVFNITDSPPPEPRSNLADSVSHVAETFIHDELTTQQEEELEHSIFLPGGFGSSDLHAGQRSSTSVNEDVTETTPGVSVISAVVENILARFTCEASDISITIILPNNEEIIITLPRFTYSDLEPTSSGPLVKKIAEFTGFVVSLRELDALFVSPDSEDSSSEYASDEELPAAMSQSIAQFTPQSVATLYDSALTAIPESPTSHLTDPHPILSWQSEPLKVVLESTFSESRDKQRTRLSSTAGPLAIALTAAQVQLLNAVVSAIGRRPSSQTQETSSSPRSSELGLTFKMRSLDILALPVMENENWGAVTKFLSHPVPIPPKFRLVHCHLNGLSVMLSPIAPGPHNLATTSVHPSRPRTNVKQISIVFSVDDIQIMGHAYPVTAYDERQQLMSLPILITDPHLSPHNSNNEFPSLQSVDWTRGTPHPKPSHWRDHSTSTSRKSLVHPTTPAPALHILISLPSSGRNFSIECSLVPLHLFFDLKHCQALTDFLTIALARSHESADVSPVHEDPPTPARHVEASSENVINKETAGQLEIACPLIRFHIRSPRPGRMNSNTFWRTRSTPMTLELYDIKVNQAQDRASVQCDRLLLYGTPLAASEHLAFLAINSLSSDDPTTSINPELYERAIVVEHPLSGMTSTRLRLANISLRLSKPLYDSLQFFADDATQLLALLSSGTMSTATSHRGSLIGSRYFLQSKRRSDPSSSFDGVETPPKKTTSLRIHVGRFSGELNTEATDQGRGLRSLLWIHARDLLLKVESNDQRKDKLLCELSVEGIDAGSELEDASKIKLLRHLPRNISSSDTPLLHIRFKSTKIPETLAQESSIRGMIYGFILSVPPSSSLLLSLSQFFKTPPGVFESVVPTEQTRISFRLSEGVIQAKALEHKGCLNVLVGDALISLVILGDGAETLMNSNLSSTSIYFVDDAEADTDISLVSFTSLQGAILHDGYALLVDLKEAQVQTRIPGASNPGELQTVVSNTLVSVHLCADTISGLVPFIGALDFGSKVDEPASEIPAQDYVRKTEKQDIMTSVEPDVFSQPPPLGLDSDFIVDDLPTNPEFLDYSFKTSEDFRDWSDDGLEEPDTYDIADETIKILHPEGIQIIEGYFDGLPAHSSDKLSEYGTPEATVQILESNISLHLHDGFDWRHTREVIEDESKRIRRRLQRIRQLLAEGQAVDPSVEETHSLLFNSVFLAIDENAENLEHDFLLAAIDEELDGDSDAATESSWQSLKKDHSSKPPALPHPARRKRLTRSRKSRVEFQLQQLQVKFDKWEPNSQVSSRVLITVNEIEILDHIKTSTWKTFLTSLRSDSQGNIREAGSSMFRAELLGVRPVTGSSSEELRLRAKILPLRLHVDQDALDFLKTFFAFSDGVKEAKPAPPPSPETFFQHAEIFPVHIKLDYKPKRVDYRALKEGRTIELMNFFHFDGAEMTLRHMTLSGITGWPRLFDTLNDVWTPDVKANQLADIISGVDPIRSFVNVGSGVADLVLLPIAQYQKDRRVVRGVQKGATSFVKSTAMEAIKLGARLATGTQVILEHAENVLGGRVKDTVTMEAIPSSGGFERRGSDEDSDSEDPISRYGRQPKDLKEGLQLAYKSLSKNLNLAGQTILALPMEVHERADSEGPARTVVRAVPIAILKPMIGATEAVSKTLLGLQNTLNPGLRRDVDTKYK